MWKLKSLSVKGLQGTSLIDFPGLVAAVVFTGGCNLRCGYCQNADLWTAESLPDIPAEQVFLELRFRAGFVDGVVVSGGEPTLHEGLPDFLGHLHEMGFKAKLDTNGTRPDMLGRILAEGLADYVAMDYKAPLARLQEKIPGMDAAAAAAVARSAKMLLDGGAPFEFRTTVHPDVLTREDLLEIAEEIHGAPAYYLQPCRPLGSASVVGRDYSFYEEMEALLKPRFPRFAIRGLHRREAAAPL